MNNNGVLLDSHGRPYDSVQPGSWSVLPMRILPDGSILFEFDGVIFARGLSMDALLNQSDLNTIEWVEPVEGRQDALIWGSGAPVATSDTSLLSMIAQRFAANNYARIVLESGESLDGDGLLGRIDIAVRSPSQGNQQVKLLDSLGASDFIRQSLADATYARPPDLEETLAEASGVFGAGGALGVKLIGQGTGLITPGVNVTVPAYVFILNPATYAVASGMTPKLRVRAVLTANAISPSGVWTFGLYPITATGGAAGGQTYTAGAVVAGSTAPTINNPTGRNEVNSGLFDIPALGWYCLGVSLSAASAASSWTNITAKLALTYS